MGLQMPKPGIWQRRSDLRGVYLRVSFHALGPLSTPIWDTQGKNIIDAKGFFIDILRILSKELNFTIEYVKGPDGTWAGKDENGNWTGLVGMLVREW